MGWRIIAIVRWDKQRTANCHFRLITEKAIQWNKTTNKATLEYRKRMMPLRDKVYPLSSVAFSFAMKKAIGSHSAAFFILNRGRDLSVSLANVTQTICPFWVQRRRKVAAALERIARISPELALERRGF